MTTQLIPLNEGTVWLMNSAMMPVPGRYEFFALTADEFAAAVRQADADGSLVSCIGYQDNVRLLEHLTGFRVELSRRETQPEDGDVMLVMRLRRRMEDPRQKGRFTPRLEDFEFGVVHYRAD